MKRLADLDLTNQRSAQLKPISVRSNTVPETIIVFGAVYRIGLLEGKTTMLKSCTWTNCNSANSKCTFVTFPDKQKQNTKQ